MPKSWRSSKRKDLDASPVRRHSTLAKRKIKRTSTGPVRIRDMTIDDIPDVYHIGEEVFTQSDFIFLYRTWESYEVTGLFTTDSDLCIVASTPTTVIGFALGSVIQKPRSPWMYGYLVWLAVAKANQRGSVGKRLYIELERRVHQLGARMMIIDTEGSNTRAVRFFSRMGFRHGSTHLWMTKRLLSQRS